MNQHILALALEAGLEIATNSVGMPIIVAVDTGRLTDPQAGLDKFSQLMIKMCVQTLINNGYDDAAKCLQEVHFGLDNPV